jgi:carbonic anhydrase
MVRAIFAVALSLALAGLAGAWPDDTTQPQEPKEAKALTPDAALARLKEGHARFLAGKLKPRKIDLNFRAELAKGQNPFAALLTCADSRVPPTLLFDQGLGDLFTLRVAGNVTAPSILGSLEYAVIELRVPLIVVVGHEKCGAVKAAIEDEDPDGNLGFLLREIHIGKHLPADKKAAFESAVKTNTGFHAAEIVKRSTVLKDFVQSGRLKVAAGVFSLSHGEIEWLPPFKKATAHEKH